ncbi:lysophospholipid acyltransferase family protein [Falsihalocynthiibacter sp. SS001]|uniref:lysophospholipid acyltransferase family protein n=1 Tax=Falsihalocynthiibacter sp. SS001 TaxID=3349698 RepID=UPI0036D2E37C
MKYAIQWMRSLIFIIQMYVMMFVLALYYTPLAVFNRDYAYHGVHTYCRYVRWSAKWLIGLKTEIRGEVPTDEVLIASKHQSFLDIIMIVSVVPRPKFIMKAILRYAPILGWYGMRIGCVPVNRGKRGAAIKKMIEDVKSGAQLPGQLIIYPQGTRVAPGDRRPYKVGVGVLYEQTGQACVPAATNVGVFWPRHGIYRKPGTAVVEFFPPIPPGTPVKEFMAELASVIEPASDRLLEEAGYKAGSDA